MRNILLTIAASTFAVVQYSTADVGVFTQDGVASSNGYTYYSSTNEVAVSNTPLDVYKPRYGHGIYTQDGVLIFEENSRTHFAFHNGDADVEYTNDFSTNWVTLWTDGATNHECGVITSNYISIISWSLQTNRVVWSSTRITSQEPPQRDAVQVPQSNSIMFFSGMTNYFHGGATNVLNL